MMMHVLLPLVILGRNVHKAIFCPDTGFKERERVSKGLGCEGRELGICVHSSAHNGLEVK